MSARPFRTLPLVLLIAAGACSDSMTGPEVGPAPEMLLSHVDGPLPATHVYDFEACSGDFGDYEDLDVTVTPLAPGGHATCVVNAGDTEVHFFNAEASIDLGGTARSVSVDFSGYGGLEIFDDQGLLLHTLFPGGPDGGSYTAPEGVVIGSLRVTGLDLVLDDLTVEYLTVDEGGDDPTDRDECKDGSWEALGFANQGQCIRFVNTGQDSRVELP